MNTVCPVKTVSVPEEVEVVNEGYMVGDAGGLEPGVETEDAAKTL